MCFAMVGTFLHFQLTLVLGKGETEAAELSGLVIGKYERVICDWKSKYLETNEVPSSKHGKYMSSLDK